MSSKIYRGECPPIIFVGLVSLGIMLAMSGCMSQSEKEYADAHPKIQPIMTAEGCEIKLVSGAYSNIYIAKCKATDSVTLTYKSGKQTLTVVNTEETEKEKFTRELKAAALNKLSAEEKAVLNITEIK